MIVASIAFGIPPLENTLAPCSLEPRNQIDSNLTVKLANPLMGVPKTAKY